MKPASFRQWGEFGPHIPIRPVSKAILHNAAQRTAAEQDFDFPQCDSNFIFLWKATWLLRLESRDEQWGAIHTKTLVRPFACDCSNNCVEASLAWRYLEDFVLTQQPLIYPDGGRFYWTPVASLTAYVWSVHVSCSPPPLQTTCLSVWMLASGIKKSRP